MNIAVLTFDGCPHAEPTIRLVERTARRLGLSLEVQQISVDDQGQAERLRFLGSPTVQIDGLDVEKNRRSDRPSLSCRVYRTPSGNSGVPPEEMIADAIREAQGP